MSVKTGLDNQMGVDCPGCDVAITIQNAGGYRTYCDECCSAIPDLPTDGGAYVLEGRYPNFTWKRVSD